ncbi:hypothetical protein DMH17_13625 [Raoultella planticola]|nr:hypothetical protein [Raoultella planticola]
MGASLGQPLPHSDAMDCFLAGAARYCRRNDAQLAVSGADAVRYLCYTPICGGIVILCAFADVSSHAEMERHLMRARKAADRSQ